LKLGFEEARIESFTASISLSAMSSMGRSADRGVRVREREDLTFSQSVEPIFGREGGSCHSRRVRRVE
jgi:hypothetical protein